MQNNTIKKIILAIILVVTSMYGLQAQEDLSINQVFEKYGKRKGSVMVVYSGKMLDHYKLKKYQSITLPWNTETSANIQKSLENDREGAHKIKEVVNNGIITSGYYQLSEQKKNTYRYILFKTGTDGTATLIYMQGGPESEELVSKLFLKQK